VFVIADVIAALIASRKVQSSAPHTLSSWDQVGTDAASINVCIQQDPWKRRRVWSMDGALMRPMFLLLVNKR
jgi:hypothetical protein